MLLHISFICLIKIVRFWIYDLSKIHSHEYWKYANIVTAIYFLKSNHKNYCFLHDKTTIFYTSVFQWNVIYLWNRSRFMFYSIWVIYLSPLGKRNDFVLSCKQTRSFNPANIFWHMLCQKRDRIKFFNTRRILKTFFEM